jgi:hypothetical protein
VPVTFIDIPGLKSGAARADEVLYLPYSYALDDQAIAAIRDFVKAGGTVWADGLTAWKNEYGELRPGVPGGLEDVFGAAAADVEAVAEPYSVTEYDEQGGQSWRLPLELKGAEVLLKDREGRPFATRHRFGNGTAIYYVSAVSLAAHHRHHPIVEGWIAAPAAERNADAPVRLTSGSRDISFRGLEYPGGKLAVLSNWGKDGQVTVSFHGSYRSIVNALGGETVSTEQRGGETAATLTVPGGAVVVLDARRLWNTPRGGGVRRDFSLLARVGASSFWNPRDSKRAD